MKREGAWFVYSKKDPRWNATGESDVGMFYMPQEVKDHIFKMRELLKEGPPDDLEWGYEKY
jgi:hypothetical protein